MTQPITWHGGGGRRGRATGACGYTLVELAVVIALMGAIAGAVALSWGGLGAEAERSKARAHTEGVREALRTFALTNARLPCPDAAASGDGYEDCGGGLDHGGVPYKTLGIAEPPARYRAAYSVYRNASESAPSGTARATAAPDLADSLLIDRTRNGVLDVNDLVLGLHNLDAAAKVDTRTHLTTDRVSTCDNAAKVRENVAFLLVVPLADQDSDGQAFDSWGQDSHRCAPAPSEVARWDNDDLVVAQPAGALAGWLRAAHQARGVAAAAPNAPLADGATYTINDNGSGAVPRVSSLKGLALDASGGRRINAQDEVTFDLQDLDDWQSDNPYSDYSDHLSRGEWELANAFRKEERDSMRRRFKNGVADLGAAQRTNGIKGLGDLYAQRDAKQERIDQLKARNASANREKIADLEDEVKALNDDIDAQRRDLDQLSDLSDQYAKKGDELAAVEKDIKANRSKLASPWLLPGGYSREAYAKLQQEQNDLYARKRNLEKDLNGLNKDIEKRRKATGLFGKGTDFDSYGRELTNKKRNKLKKKGKKQTREYLRTFK